MIEQLTPHTSFVCSFLGCRNEATVTAEAAARSAWDGFYVSTANTGHGRFLFRFTFE